MIKKNNCPVCESINSLFEYKKAGVDTTTCEICGYVTNIGMKLGTDSEKSVRDSLPSLYNLLEVIDDEKYVWHPVSIIEKDKAILFADGNVDAWGWRVASYIEPDKDDKFYKKGNYKIDMPNSTLFPNNMFPAALYLFSILVSK